MSTSKYLVLCSLSVSVLFTSSFAYDYFGVFSRLALHVDTQIETPVKKQQSADPSETEGGGYDPDSAFRTSRCGSLYQWLYGGTRSAWQDVFHLR